MRKNKSHACAQEEHALKGFLLAWLSMQEWSASVDACLQVKIDYFPSSSSSSYELQCHLSLHTYPVCAEKMEPKLSPTCPPRSFAGACIVQGLRLRNVAVAGFVNAK